jgi:hypothetical protein
MTQIYEGTWEEIAAHAEEWENKRLRVSVEVLEEESANEQARLQNVLSGLVGASKGLPPDLSENTGQKFAEIIAEKHQEGRL